MPDPDLGIDAVAIEELAYATEDVGLSLALVDTLLDLLDNLSARVAALEN